LGVREGLNPETGEISPDRGNHAIKVTRAVGTAWIFGSVFIVPSATSPVNGQGACVGHLLPRR
jgi:hypothetical protein